MELPVQQFRSKPEQELLDAFTAAERNLPGARNAWVAALRTKAIERFGSLGLPHRRIEQWKYTDLRSRLTELYPPVQPLGAKIGDSDIARALGPALAALPAYRLVIAEGELRDDISDLSALKSAGIEALSLAAALDRPPTWFKAALGQVNPQSVDAILALNLALMTGGAVLRVPRGLSLDKPVHLIHVDGSGEPVGTVTRNVVVVEEGGSLELIESYGSLGGRGLQRNAVTELSIGDRARVDHVKVQREGEEAFHLSTWLVGLAEDARYQAFQFSTGAALSRNQIYAAFSGEGSAVNVSGAFLAREKQHCDTTLLVEHKVPRCTSRELFKGVLDNEARGVFQGKIIVSPGAQKTDGKQMAGALLLSESAEFDSKPELEIFADDVVCGHGSTSGQIDDELLFYLEARGIPEAQARALLIQAFVGEALQLIEREELREALMAATADWLGISFD